MELQFSRRLRIIGIAVLMLLAWANPSHAQTWQPLLNQPCLFSNPCFGAGTALLLTDGSVMVQATNGFQWLRLTPDANGSYINGTWSQLASLPPGYAPLYFSSAVLPDGRVIVEGGEYNFFQPEWTNQGAIFQPTTNTWTSVAPPVGWSTIGDAQNAVLANGHFMLANCCTTQAALLNPATLAWTATGTGKVDSNDEEGWTLLPDGSVLTIDVNNPDDPTHAEKYIPSTGQWISAGSTIVQLDDLTINEIGPAVLRPNGTVFATGATGHTSVYTPPRMPTAPGSWRPGPDFPYVPGEGQLVAADAPAALLPNGNVLVDASPGFGNTPTEFFEFNGSKLTQVQSPPNAASETSFVGRMLLLPTGQVLYTDGSSDLEIYTPAGRLHRAWAPAITSCPRTLVPNSTYSISGTQFNGLSQAVAYGDDAQAATNYPLVRIRNRTTGHLFYARTHDPSTMAVATGKATVSTHFDVPVNLEQGVSDLAVVANGIPSKPFRISSPGSPSLSGSILSASNSGPVVTLDLQITNSGTGDARHIQITQFGLRTLTGTGTVAFLGRLPLSIGSLAAGASVTVFLGFNVPAGITKFSIIEDGSFQNTIGGVYNYSIAQVAYRSR